MNDTRIRKGTIMKRTTALALLGLACLMAMPSIAHARYRDGMNLYQYVRSAPVQHVDPMGLTPWTNRRTTISVQGLVGAKQDNLYGPETCAKVKVYQGGLKGKGYLGSTTVSGRNSVDGKWGDQTEDAHLWRTHCTKLKKLRERYRSAYRNQQSLSDDLRDIYDDALPTYLWAEGLRQFGHFVIFTEEMPPPDPWDVYQAAKRGAHTEIEQLHLSFRDLMIPAIEAVDYGVHIKRHGFKLRSTIASAAIFAGHMVASHYANERQNERWENLFAISEMFAEATIRRDLHHEAFMGYAKVVRQKCPAQDQ